MEQTKVRRLKMNTIKNIILAIASAILMSTSVSAREPSTVPINYKTYTYNHQESEQIEKQVQEFEDIPYYENEIRHKIKNNPYATNSAEIKPSEETIIRPDNLVLYPYGLAQPNLICEKFRVCTVTLQEGEVIMNVGAGDSIRWNTRVGWAGEGNRLTPILMIKPLFGNGIETNFIITTNKNRVYSIHAKSIDEGYLTPRIGFFYPQDDNNMMEQIVPPIDTREEKNGSTLTVDTMKFNYEVKGSTKLAWYPEMIFDDGRKVYIKMDKTVANRELPVFMAIGANKKTQFINYRYNEPFYVIDGMFEEGQLILNSGKKQESILIKRKKQR